jgi:tetratricopeptide (TPR) repeat protein
MAWRKLAVQHSNRGGDFDAQVQAASAAYRHRDRLTERERYLAEAYYYYTVTDDDDAAADAYRRVLENHPHDATALNNLGIYHGDQEEWEQAAALYQRAVDGPGRSRSAYNNLVLALYNTDRQEDALQVMDEWEERYPYEMGMARHRFILGWGMGDPDGALAAAAEGMERLSGDVFAQIDLRQRLGDFYASLGRTAEAREVILGRRAVAEAQGLALQSFNANQALAWLDLLEGRADTVAVLRELESRMERDLADVPPLNRPYSTMGFMWAMGAHDADRAALWFEREADTYTEEMRAAPSFQGTLLWMEMMLHAANEAYAEQLDVLRELKRRDGCDDCYQRPLARAFDGLQEPDSAIVYLEAFLAHDHFDQVDDIATQAADILPQLARLYEEVGRPEDAAAAWMRFAEQWKDADPVLQSRVRAARAEAERLTQSGN